MKRVASTLLIRSFISVTTFIIVCLHGYCLQCNLKHHYLYVNTYLIRSTSRCSQRLHRLNPGDPQIPARVAVINLPARLTHNQLAHERTVHQSVR
jgi:hypothetical protein